MQEQKPDRERDRAFFRKNALPAVLLICTVAVGITALTFSKTWKETKKLAEESSTKLYSAISETKAPEAAAAPTSEPAAPIPAEEPKQREAVEAGAEEEQPTAAETMAESFAMPLPGTVERGHSPDKLIYDRTMADFRTHDGIDIAAKLGDKVTAIADGTVEQVYEDERLGVTVVICHGGGLRSCYANLAGTPTVTPGDSVEQGQTIGAVGCTALFEQGDVPHLHLSMTQDGVSVNPRDYF